MRLRQIVERTPGLPATVESLQEDLAKLGVRSGMTLLVHSSLSSLGWVCGGAAAVVLALQNVLGPEGTLVMPTHSGDLSEPSLWQNPSVPESWWPLIREHTPPYDPDLTPTWGMGAIVECFRTQKGTLRSSHPQLSFAARGRNAERIVGQHGLHFGLGERSPLARIYDADGWVLLLGVGHENNTSLHLAEYRANYPTKTISEFAAPMLIDGRRQWVTFSDLSFDSSDFADIGEQFLRETNHTREGNIAQARAQLFPQRAIVDFAVKWMEKHR
jgi:aminoglycoside 3-N-acetyltransferase